MQLVFEPSSSAEVTQVALWQAYKDEWRAHPTLAVQMMHAGDMIKLTTTAFPGAMPNVTHDKRYVITNISRRRPA